MLALIVLFACESESTTETAVMHPPVPFSPEKATERAEEYVEKLYSTIEYNGPICIGEKVTDRYTQCSFTYMKGEELFASTILCDNAGCIEGSAPAVVPAENRPTTVVENNQDSGVPDDWLLWYMLMNSGGTTHSYHTWYGSTPEYGRTAYYSSSYRPSVESTSYYKSTYSVPMTSGAAKTYKAKYTPSVSSSSKTTSKSTSTTTTSTKSRSSGWGSSSRSSGYKSSGSSSRSGRR